MSWIKHKELVILLILLYCPHTIQYRKQKKKIESYLVICIPVALLPLLCYDKLTAKKENLFDASFLPFCVTESLNFFKALKYLL